MVVGDAIHAPRYMDPIGANGDALNHSRPIIGMLDFISFGGSGRFFWHYNWICRSVIITPQYRCHNTARS